MGEASETSRRPLLRLFVAGRGAASQRAVTEVRDLCERELDSAFDLEVVDVTGSPELAKAARILALPVLMREEPAPARRLVGDFSDRNRVAAALGLQLARRRAAGSTGTE